MQLFFTRTSTSALPFKFNQNKAYKPIYKSPKMKNTKREGTIG